MNGSALHPVFVGLTTAEMWTLVIAIVCNVACAILGCYLVLRKLSLMGDAISHAVLPGIAMAALLSGGRYTSVGIFVGAMAVGVLTTFLTQTLRSFGKVPEDASLGIVFTSLFAIGVILISKSKSIANVDLDANCVLYGLLELVSFWPHVDWFGLMVPQPFPTMLLALGVTVVFVVVLWKELKITTFDPALATAMGINAVFVHYLLMALVAGVTVAAFEAVGSILVIVMLIVPPATAYLLTERLGAMMVWATIIAVATAVLGMFLAPENASLSGMMAVVAGGIFGVTALFAPKHGILAKIWRNTQLGLRIVSEDILAALYRQEEAGAEPSFSLAGLGFRGRLAAFALTRQGEVEAGPQGLTLTQQGRARAQSIVRAHRLWEAYLGKHFDLPPDHLHEPATRMEHFLDPAMQQQLAAELDQPGLDPHGRAIPPGKTDGIS